MTLSDHTSSHPEGVSISHYPFLVDTAVIPVSVDGVAERSLERWAAAFECRDRPLLLAVEDPAKTDTRWSAPVIGPYPETVRFAWDATPTSGTADQARWMLEAFGYSLECVRVPGTGPEGIRKEDGRIGSLVSVMTLLGYRGPGVLAPGCERRAPWPSWRLPVHAASARPGR